MRKSRADAEESRRRIVEVASRLYREHGFNGVGVADIMEAAGMTHGGFYRHFTSKEELIAAAIAEAFSIRRTRMDALDQDNFAQDYIRMYLAPGHVERPGSGCPIPALGSEAIHVGKGVGEVFTDGIEETVARLANSLDGTPAERRKGALRLLAELVGAIVIARASAEGSPLRKDVLDAARGAEARLGRRNARHRKPKRSQAKRSQE